MSTDNLASKLGITLGDNTPLLGELVFWNSSDFTIDKDAAAQAWKDCGLPEKLFRFQINPTTTLHKAIRRHRLTKEQDLKGFKDPEKMKSICLREGSIDDGSGIIKYETENAGQISVTTDGIFERTSNHPLLIAIEETYAEIERLLDADNFRALLVRCMDWMRAISLRQRGGTYFITESESDNLRKVKSYFSQIPQIVLCTFPIIGTEDAKKSIGDTLELEIMNEVESLQAEVTKNAEVDEFTLRKMKTKMKQLSDLKKKAELYDTYVEVKMEKIFSTINQFEHKIREQFEV